MALEYAVPAVPAGRVALIVRVGAAAAAMTSESATDLVCAGLAASVTVAEILLVPLAVGVPEIRPVDAVSVRPAGRVPAVIDQE
jgi:hypothetical protein